jgi:branched-chain amino acid transport system ATP-binding protein
MSGLRCQSLRKAFGGVVALDNVSLDFGERGCVAVIGPNGSGKTTLLDTMTGFERPDRGRCFVAGLDTTALPAEAIARLGVRRTFQGLRLANAMSVMDHLLLACDPYTQGLLPALFDLRAQEREERDRRTALRLLDELGIAGLADDAVGTLSYGQQKLVSIACSVIAEPSIVLLDEPVAGVHPQLVENIVQWIGRLRDRLVIVVEHDMATVRRVADRVIVLDRGAVIADGPPKEVLARPEVLEAYVG